MQTLSSPAARRLRPPSWRDSRLVVGVVLVLTSVVLGALAFRAADDRTGVWAARADLTTGDPVTEADLVRVDVRLGDGAAQYLQTSQGLPADAVLERDLRPGELVPRSSLVPPGNLDVQPVPVRVDAIDVTTLAKGSLVSVYAGTPEDDVRSGEGMRYELVLERVTVAEIPEERRGVMSGSGSAPVVLVIPREEVASLLSLQRKDAPLKLVANRTAAEGSR